MAKSARGFALMRCAAQADGGDWIPILAAGRDQSDEEASRRRDEKQEKTAFLGSLGLACRSLLKGDGRSPAHSDHLAQSLFGHGDWSGSRIDVSAKR